MMLGRGYRGLAAAFGALRHEGAGAQLETFIQIGNVPNDKVAVAA